MPAFFQIVAWTWQQWSILAALVLLCLAIVSMAVMRYWPRRPPPGKWKRYNRDSRYL